MRQLPTLNEALLADLRKGDRIQFSSPTRWAGFAVVWRVITGFRSDGAVNVRYGGYGDFRVELHEIKDVERRGRAAQGGGWRGGGGETTLDVMLQDARRDAGDADPGYSGCRKWLELFAGSSTYRTDADPPSQVEFERFNVEGLCAEFTVYGPEGLNGARGGLILSIERWGELYHAAIEFSWGGKHIKTLTRSLRDACPRPFFDQIAGEYLDWKNTLAGSPLEGAAQRVIDARDHHADNGSYPVPPFGPNPDTQAFDDWAADLLQAALRNGEEK